ncbi:MAG TPA: acyloxyacyl hydrolase, partial [Pyrinomonadaceae bacterium]|nr:acyloxyacyl hydrolase [Pyrinomonadaceae bacterium]
VPLAIVFQPDFARAFNRHPDHSVYGAGISPIGFRFIFNRQGKIKPFASTSGGFLYFRRPVPVDVSLATRFNFTFEFSGGVQFFTGTRRAVTIGYRFQHISNGGRSVVNPGLDANVIYAGFSLFK